MLWDDDLRIPIAEQALLRVQTQIGFAFLDIRPVACGTRIRQNRPDIPIEIHRFGGPATAHDRSGQNLRATTTNRRHIRTVIPEKLGVVGIGWNLFFATRKSRPD